MIGIQLHFCSATPTALIAALSSNCLSSMALQLLAGSRLPATIHTYKRISHPDITATSRYTATHTASPSSKFSQYTLRSMNVPFRSADILSAKHSMEYIEILQHGTRS